MFSKMVTPVWEVITSVQNDLVRSFCKLKEKKYRNIEQRFIVEGYHLVEEAYRAKQLEVVLSRNKDILTQYSCVKCYHVTDAIIEKLSNTVHPQPIVGIVRKKCYDISNIEAILTKATVKLIILDEVKDPGNLGTIIRTAAGLGYDMLCLSEETVDLYNDKTIRSSQGALFKIPIIRIDLYGLIPLLKREQVICYGTSLQQAIDVRKVFKPKRFALCFGNEAHGVREPVLRLMDQNIQLSMHRDVESFNVMVASSIVMYEFIRNEE